MAYEPPRHILLRRQTDAIADKDLAFLERALVVQLQEVGAAYGLPVPGVSLVTPDTHLPTEEALGIDFVDDDGKPDAIAHHGWMPAAGFPWALVGVAESPEWTVSASHEVLEAFINLRLDQYVTEWEYDSIWPRRRWPKEICDPVEANSYPIECDLFGERRSVPVSNWVTPAFWQSTAAPPYDRLSVLTSPMTIAPGGYALVERDGAIQEMGGAQSVRHGKQSAPRPASRVAALRALPRQP